jgi:drug/metabolite transporter (DMT)-like permease
VTPLALVLVVAAAVLHAAWNALAKRGRDPLVFLWSSGALSSLLLAPWAAWWLAAEGLPRAALPFVGATIAIHVVYFWALGRSYGAGDYSRVYPIARGLGVALVPLLAVALFDEWPSRLGAAGIGLVVLGIAAFSLPGPRAAAPGGRGTGWAVLTGLTIAAYSLVDRAGVARLHPVPYITLLGAGSVLVLTPLVLARPERLRAEWRSSGRAILVSATMNLTAYLLVLFAFRLSKLGYVVAARELSIVISTVIGWRWLGEGQLGLRLGAATVVLAGVLLVAAAR